MQAKKHIALQNQRYLWFASIDFLYFFANYKQENTLKTAIEFDLPVRFTFEKLSDFSMHIVYWDTLYSRAAKPIHCAQNVKTVRLCTEFNESINNIFLICHTLWHFQDGRH